MNEQKESDENWSKEFLAWGDLEQEGEGLDIACSGSHWREINFSDLIDYKNENKSDGRSNTSEA